MILFSYGLNHGWLSPGMVKAWAGNCFNFSMLVMNGTTSAQ